jgi:fatty-acyl-CoA synthase
MHGTGWFQAMIAWLVGGVTVVLESARKFDAAELWRTVDAKRITSITIVGDPFAKPMADELEQNGDAYDISSVIMIASSGVMWSEETKQRLLAHHSGLVLADAFSSSEAVGMGISFTTAAGSVQTGKFQLSDTTKLFNADLELIESKPGTRGLVGVGGLQPLGYYKDPEKSAKTFVECEAGRFSIPGDWAEVGEDGLTLTLLGRGSVCINTGGEKVFPEEVEEVIKRFEGVKDAVVVGVPDDRWGEAVTAVVSSHEGALDGAAIIAHVKGSLAGYKAPKHVVQVPEVYRSPAGKADFKRTRQMAMERLGIAG